MVGTSKCFQGPRYPPWAGLSGALPPGIVSIEHEVRRITSRPDSLCSVVLPEIVVAKRRYLLLHGQSGLFVKRLLLYEPRVVLSSVPFRLEG